MIQQSAIRPSAEQLSAQAPSGASPRLAGLARRHAALEARLAELGARPRADDAEIKRLKREKLLLKDRMAAH